MLTSGKKYQIVFRGELEEGTNVTEVKQRLAATFKTTVERIEKLFATTPAIINQNLDESTAQEYVRTLQAIGIRCSMEPMPEVFVIPPPKTVATVQKQQAEKIKGSEGNLGVGITIASAMALLLFLYGVLIIFLLRSLFLHIDENLEWSETLDPTFGIILYVLVILVYCGLLFVLIKPFFPTSRKQTSLIVAKKKEPAIYTFIEKICAALGSKTPTLIEFTCGTSIAINYKQGILSFLEEQQTLSIGFPFFSQLTLPEFACAVANDLAFYANTAKARIYYFVKHILNFFHRNATQTDDIFEEKVRIAKNIAGNIFGRFFFLLLLAFLWLGKKVNSIFFLIGKSISKSYLISMEFEADKIAAHLVGNDVFESTLLKQFLTKTSWKEALELLQKERKPNDRSIPNDFVELISLILKEKPEEELAKIKERWGKITADTNPWLPSPQERIQSVKKKGYKGIFSSDKTALSLLNQPSELTKTLTTRFYREELQIQFSSEDLISAQNYIHPPESNEMILDSTSDDTSGFF